MESKRKRGREDRFRKAKKGRDMNEEGKEQRERLESMGRRNGGRKKEGELQK